MLSNMGRVLLVATALAPILLVYGAAIFFEHRVLATSLAVVAALLVALCHLLLRMIRRHGTNERVEVEAITAKDTEILSFLVAYMLPIILGEQVKANPLAITVFIGIMALVFFRSDIYHVNPLMGMLGYHFYEVTATSKVTYLLVTDRKDPLTPDDLITKRLSRNLLLEMPQAELRKSKVRD